MHNVCVLINMVFCVFSCIYCCTPHFDLSTMVINSARQSSAICYTSMYMSVCVYVCFCTYVHSFILIVLFSLLSLHEHTFLEQQHSIPIFVHDIKYKRHIVQVGQFPPSKKKETHFALDWLAVVASSFEGIYLDCRHRYISIKHKYSSWKV